MSHVGKRLQTTDVARVRVRVKVGEKGKDPSYLISGGTGGALGPPLEAEMDRSPLLWIHLSKNKRKIKKRKITVHSCFFSTKQLFQYNEIKMFFLFFSFRFYQIKF